MILTSEIEDKAPALYTTDDRRPSDMTVMLKLIDYVRKWSLYVISYDPDQKLVFGISKKNNKIESGYFDISTFNKSDSNVQIDFRWKSRSLEELKKYFINYVDLVDLI